MELTIIGTVAAVVPSAVPTIIRVIGIIAIIIIKNGNDLTRFTAPFRNR